LSADIADAIEDHYKPRFAGDELPRNRVGQCVALADKLETLVGLFGIGEKPTGDKDPFALRRHALGVIRILVDRELPIDISTLLAIAISVFTDRQKFDEILKSFGDAYVSELKEVYPDKHFVFGGTNALLFNENTVTSLLDFIYDRLEGGLREQGYSTLEVNAVVCLRPQRFNDIPKRLAAVRAFAALPEAEPLAAANKRVGNILKKAEGVVEARVDTALLKEPAELALNVALAQVKPTADAAFAAGDYTASLQALAALKAPVDDFFNR
jgi:glycyl-tRNA synthetase beta chain